MASIDFAFSRNSQPMLILRTYHVKPAIIKTPIVENSTKETISITSYCVYTLAQTGITSFTTPLIDSLSKSETITVLRNQNISYQTLENICCRMYLEPVNLNNLTREIAYSIYHAAIVFRDKNMPDIDSVSFGSLLEKCSSVRLIYHNAASEISITLDYMFPLHIYFIEPAIDVIHLKNLKCSDGVISHNTYLCDFQYQYRDNNCSRFCSEKVREMCFISLLNNNDMRLYQHMFSNIYFDVYSGKRITKQNIISKYENATLLNMGNYDRSVTPFPNLVNLQSAIGAVFTYLSHLFRSSLDPCKLCRKNEKLLQKKVLGTEKPNSINAYRDCAFVNTCSMLIAINNLIYTKQLYLAGKGSFPICVLCNKPLGIQTKIYGQFGNTSDRHPCVICDQKTKVSKDIILNS